MFRSCSFRDVLTTQFDNEDTQTATRSILTTSNKELLGTKSIDRYYY